MKKLLINYGGYIFFYLVLIIGIIVLGTNVPQDQPKNLNEINYPINY